MQLFDDQVDFIHRLAKAVSVHRKVLAQAATGFGKTFVFSWIANSWVNKNKTSVLIFAHREELVSQTRKTLYKEYKIEAFLVVAGVKYIPPTPVYVGMIESCFRRLHKLNNIGLVIIDEAHRGEFAKLHKEFPDVKVLGFTATPVSANRKVPLSSFYEAIVCGPQISTLQALKRLSYCITYNPKEFVEESELVIKGSDYDEEKMAQVYRKSKHINGTINAYRARGVGLKTLIFNVNIQHSLDVTKAFTEAGYKCRHLGSNNEHERKEIISWLNSDPHAIVSNVGIATTGLDCPSVEHIILNKDTLSLSNYIQIVGRGGRIVEYLKYLFFFTDMGTNWRRFGEWQDDRDWEDVFWHPPKPSKPGVPTIKSCPQCDALIAASAKVCRYCEYEFPEKPISPEQAFEEFVIVTKNIDPVAIINENKDRKEYSTVFEMGRRLAHAFFEKGLEANEKNFNLCLQIYHSLAKKWCKERGKKYNEYNSSLVVKTLHKEFQTYFSEWPNKAQ